MKENLEKIVQMCSSVNEWIGKNTAWLTTILMLFICYDVVMRYLLDETSVWIIELEWHLFALIFLFGAGYTLKYDRHVRVDLFYAKWSEQTKAWVNLIGSLFLLGPWCYIIAATAYYYTLNSYMINETSPDPGGLPARYLIKGAIVLGFFFLFLQALALVAQSLLVIFYKQANRTN